MAETLLQTQTPTRVYSQETQRHLSPCGTATAVLRWCSNKGVVIVRSRAPADRKPIAPPMLLCPTALEQQLSAPLRQTAKPECQIQATLVIAPTNLFGLKAIDWIHHWQLRNNKVFATDVGDGWNINRTALAQLLTTLFKQRQQVVILSGDIHYSSMVRLTYEQASSAQLPCSFVQLTCSALKNEETLTQLVHTRLKDWLLPEQVRRWLGWSNPPSMVEISPRQSRRDRRSLHPDWICTLEWIPRHHAQTPQFKDDLSWLMPPGKRVRNAKHKWFKPLIFWKSRWFQEGREVVGLNNLALVQFKSADTSCPGTVIQDLYWFSSWQPIQIVYSRFESYLISDRTLPDKM